MKERPFGLEAFEFRVGPARGIIAASGPAGACSCPKVLAYHVTEFTLPEHAGPGARLESSHNPTKTWRRSHLCTSTERARRTCARGWSARSSRCAYAHLSRKSGTLTLPRYSCDADPGALADYVAAILDRDSPEAALRVELIADMEDFLQKGMSACPGVEAHTLTSTRLLAQMGLASSTNCSTSSAPSHIYRMVPGRRQALLRTGTPPWARHPTLRLLRVPLASGHSKMTLANIRLPKGLVLEASTTIAVIRRWVLRSA
jgi:hypothetical protein